MQAKYVFVETPSEVSKKYFANKFNRKLHFTTMTVEKCWTDKDTLKFLSDQDAIEAYYTYTDSIADKDKIILHVCYFWN
jgi:hypothetical protein